MNYKILYRSLFILLVFVLFFAGPSFSDDIAKYVTENIGATGGKVVLLLGNGAEVSVDISPASFNQKVALCLSESEAFPAVKFPASVVAIFSLQTEVDKNIELQKPIGCNLRPRNGVDMGLVGNLRVYKLALRKNGDQFWDRVTRPYVKDTQSPISFTLSEFGIYMVKYSRISLGDANQVVGKIRTADFDRGDKFFKLSRPWKTDTDVVFQLKLSGVEKIAEEIKLIVTDDFGNKVYDSTEDELLVWPRDNYWEFTVDKKYFPANIAGKYHFSCEEQGLFGEELWSAFIIRDWPSIAGGNQEIINNLLDMLLPA